MKRSEIVAILNTLPDVDVFPLFDSYCKIKINHIYHSNSNEIIMVHDLEDPFNEDDQPSFLPTPGIHMSDDDFPRTFSDFIGLARPITMAELDRVSITDTLKLMILTLKSKELANAIKYHELVHRVEEVVTDEEVLIKIFNKD